MTRSKDIKKMGEIAAEYEKGATINEIAAKVGMTRQTVSAYLRSPQLQKAVDGVQEGLIGVLAKALEYLDQVVSGKAKNPDNNRLKASLLLVDKLGSKIIEQTNVANQSREVEVLTPEERTNRLTEVKKLLMEDKDAVQE